MIDYIREEPTFAKGIKLLLTGLFVMTVILLCIHYYCIDRLHSQYMNSRQEIVGRLVEKYPQRELDIVKTVNSTGHKHFYIKGKAILEKYGYDDSLKSFQDGGFRGIFMQFFISDVVSLLFMTIALLVLLMCIFKKLYNRVKKFSSAIDCIVEGNFIINVCDNEEGILSGIGVSLEKVVRRLVLSLESIKKEKENIKMLITDISHQLKTPVSSIKMFNALLGEEELTEEDKKYFLEQSRYEIERLEELVSGLVKMSRLEVGMLDLQKEKGRLSETVCQAVNGILLKAADKGIQVNIGEIGEYIIPHDMKWTREALFNVLENAIKYTPAGGSIEILVTEMVSFIRIDIKDNGIGIPSEEYNDIFRRFYRGKSEYVKRADGAGVGLYLTRKILEEQGGSITVSSVVGSGTRFSLFLQKC